LSAFTVKLEKKGNWIKKIQLLEGRRGRRKWGKGGRE
jgi:hypothetical protein